MSTTFLLLSVFSVFGLYAGLMLVLRFTLPPKDAERRLKLSLVGVGAWMIATALFSYFELLNRTTHTPMTITVLVFPLAAALILAISTPADMQQRMPLGLLLIVQSFRSVSGAALLIRGHDAHPLLVQIGSLELALGIGALLVWGLVYRRNRFGRELLQAWYALASITATGSVALLGLSQAGKLSGAPDLLTYPGVWVLTFFYPTLLWLLLMGCIKAFRHSAAFDRERQHDPSN